jgi:hypothetical protein
LSTDTSRFPNYTLCPQTSETGSVRKIIHLPKPKYWTSLGSLWTKVALPIAAPSLKNSEFIYKTTEYIYIYIYIYIHTHNYLRVKAIPITGSGGLQACEMLRITHFIDKRLTDGSKVSHMHRPSSTTQKHYLSASDTHFCQRLSKSQGLVRWEELGELEKKKSPHRFLNPLPSDL